LRPRKLTTLLLVVLFAAPVLAAMVLRVTGWSPSATSNHGELVRPPVPVTWPAGVADAASDHWVLLAVAPSTCGQSCIDLVDELVHVHVALGRDEHRVTLMLAGPDELPGLMRDAPVNLAGRALLEQLPDSVPATPGTVLVVDPRRFLMMRYPPGFDAKGLLDDMERLLRYSRVGVQ